MDTPQGTPHIVVLGSGIAGMVAALTAVNKGAKVTLVSQAGVASGSLMAEGGINAVLNHNKDDAKRHEDDTLKSAAGMVSKTAVRNLTDAACTVIARLSAAGVQFTRDGDGMIAQRVFGGQGMRRTCYAKESTGKQIVSALADSVRKCEVEGTIKRMSNHLIVDTIVTEEGAKGCIAFDLMAGKPVVITGDALIVATGGMGGLFRKPTTVVQNTGMVVANLFLKGAECSNLEFVQYHPTTISVGMRRALISESARGEGGRLCVFKGDDTPCYFLEEKYPELGRKANLLTRDIVARECYEMGKEAQVYLDLRDIPREAYKGRLSDTFEDCVNYLHLDPQKYFIPVEPGVHYFMGGLRVDINHRTNIQGLYAAGECCAQYHGANRLGGNSLLGAAYGGSVAAKSAIEDALKAAEANASAPAPAGGPAAGGPAGAPGAPVGGPAAGGPKGPANPAALERIKDIMGVCMGVERTEEELASGVEALKEIDNPLARLAQASAMSALARKESRGAHFRIDYPEQNDAEFGKVSVARFKNGQIEVSFEEVPE